MAFGDVECASFALLFGGDAGGEVLLGEVEAILGDRLTPLFSVRALLLCDSALLGLPDRSLGE